MQTTTTPPCRGVAPPYAALVAVNFGSSTYNRTKLTRVLTVQRKWLKSVAVETRLRTQPQLKHMQMYGFITK